MRSGSKRFRGFPQMPHFHCACQGTVHYTGHAPRRMTGQSEHRFQAIVNSPRVSAAGAADVGNLFTMRAADRPFSG